MLPFALDNLPHTTPLEQAADPGASGASDASAGSFNDYLQQARSQRPNAGGNSLADGSQPSAGLGKNQDQIENADAVPTSTSSEERNAAAGTSQPQTEMDGNKSSQTSLGQGVGSNRQPLHVEQTQAQDTKSQKSGADAAAVAATVSAVALTAHGQGPTAAVVSTDSNNNAPEVDSSNLVGKDPKQSPIRLSKNSKSAQSSATENMPVGINGQIAQQSGDPANLAGAVGRGRCGFEWSVTHGSDLANRQRHDNLRSVRQRRKDLQRPVDRQNRQGNGPSDGVCGRAGGVCRQWRRSSAGGRSGHCTDELHRRTAAARTSRKRPSPAPIKGRPWGKSIRPLIPR